MDGDSAISLRVACPSIVCMVPRILQSKLAAHSAEQLV